MPPKNFFKGQRIVRPVGGKKLWPKKSGATVSIGTEMVEMFLAENALAYSKEKVLSIGTGAKAFQHPTYSHVFSIDISKAGPVPGKSLKHARADAEKMPFKNDSFGLVVSSYALDYAPKEIVARELFRVLRPDGAAFLVLHHPHSSFVQASKSVISKAVQSTDVPYLGPAQLLYSVRPTMFSSRPEITRFFSKIGFRDVHAQPIHLFGNPRYLIGWQVLMKK